MDAPDEDTSGARWDDDGGYEPDLEDAPISLSGAPDASPTAATAADASRPAGSEHRTSP